MPEEYEASAELLLEVWSVLREPVGPLQSAQSRDAIERCVARACRGGEEHLHRCIERILFLAAGNREFSPKTRKDLAAMLDVRPAPQLGTCAKESRVPADPATPLSRIAAFCAKLETLGFDIDSGKLLEGVLHRQHRYGSSAVLRRTGTGASAGRLKTHAVLRARDDRRGRKIRTLRTHRGFIVQAHLDGGFDPIQLDIFGPKYNAVGEWMGLLSADAAWSLELRDAPGYDPAGRSQRQALPPAFAWG
jgi:hypothetical protein